MKISIIVPVYNMASGKKLEFCLESLINQTFSDKYEIIAVDDASTDSSLSILKKYEEKRPDLFKVISYKDNRHQGGARNEGIKAASGEWIGFLDSDDWVSPKYIETLVKRGEETGADVVGCTFNMVSSQTFDIGKIVTTNTPDQSGVLDDEKRKLIIKNPGSMVTKIYRASLIRENNLSFPEHIFYEDNASAPIWAMYYKHFEFVDEPLYYYYQYETSTVHTITSSRCMDRLSAGEILLSEAKERGFLEKFKPEIESIFTTVYFTNTLFSYMRLKKEKNYSIVKKMKKKMLEEFPKFRENPDYGRFMDDEQKRYVDLLMKNSFLFYVKYSLLWFYRDLRSKKA